MQGPSTVMQEGFVAPSVRQALPLYDCLQALYCLQHARETIWTPNGKPRTLTFWRRCGLAPCVGSFGTGVS